MSDNERALDLLLDAAREPEPADEGFVQAVMQEISPHKRGVIVRLRRPLIGGMAAAAVLAGGTVAAVVGTRPDPADSGSRPPAVQTPAGPQTPERLRTQSTERVVPLPSAAEVSSGSGVAQSGETSHSISVLDPDTGLQLTLDTYVDTIEAGIPHQVKVELKNTGSDPLALSPAHDGCLMRVMAFPLDASQREQSFDEGCASEESLVLQPGEDHVAHAEIILASGEWGVVGMCECTPSEGEVEASSGGRLLNRAQLSVPSLLDLEIGVRQIGLTTAPLRVHAV